jgi:hypothetical protein
MITLLSVFPLLLDRFSLLTYYNFPAKPELSHAIVTKIFTRQDFDCSEEETTMNNKERLSEIELRFAGRAENHFNKALKKQMELHEGVTFIDILKFLYQSSLGSFHLLEMMNETELENWIRKNLEDAKPSDGPLTEELYDKKWVRLNFGPYKKKYGDDYQRIHEAFVTAKSMKQGELKEYKALLKKLVDTIEKEEIRPLTDEPMFFSLVESFLKEYEENDYPPIHHSKTYMLKNSSEYLVISYSSLDKIV